MSQFYIPSSTATTSAYTSDDDEEDTLPYPTELARNDFLAPDFDPLTYLSSLRNRHQTLEDLRSDLRARSQLLNQELLNLVNGNYEEFLSLGADLTGGEEKVEGVRVGLLGFRREIEGISKAFKERSAEMENLLEEKKGVGKDVALGRALLEIDARLAEMEDTLGITEKDDDVELDDLDDDDSSLEDDGASTTVRRLQRHTRSFILLTRMIERVGAGHPFMQAQQPRVTIVKKTLLLDLAAALRQAKAAKEPDAILGIVRMFGDMGAEGESVRVLRGG